MAKGQISLIAARCNACGSCVEFCPQRVLALSLARNSRGCRLPHVVQPEKCDGCDFCRVCCPCDAISAGLVSHALASHPYPEAPQR